MTKQWMIYLGVLSVLCFITSCQKQSAVDDTQTPGTLPSETRLKSNGKMEPSTQPASPSELPKEFQR